MTTPTGTDSAVTTPAAARPNQIRGLAAALIAVLFGLVVVGCGGSEAAGNEQPPTRS